MRKGRIIRLTEEQAKRLNISEDIQIQADVAAANGDVRQAFNNAKKEAIAAGIPKDKIDIVISANESHKRDSDFHINECQVFTINDLFKKR